MENILQIWPHFKCKQTPENIYIYIYFFFFFFIKNKQKVYILVAAMGIQNSISKHLLAVIIKEKLDI